MIPQLVRQSKADNDYDIINKISNINLAPAFDNILLGVIANRWWSKPLSS